MPDDVESPTVGAVALAGSGEYTPAMRATDAALLATCPADGPVRVVVCPTAAGAEAPASPARWAQLGVDHFTALGARVEAAMILNRAGAEGPRWLPLLEAADFYYFSGGDPGYLIATLADSPAWAVIRRRYLAGAALAGCSAGAMALGAWAIRRPGPGRGAFQPGLAILPHIISVPHFDRWGRSLGTPLIDWTAQHAPAGTVIVGIDEDTALLRRAATGAPPAWVVEGRQTVTVFRGPESARPQVYRAGDDVPLPFA